ncbi:hypothetical protein V8E54_011951 [Elaphomyces granulatus]
MKSSIISTTIATLLAASSAVPIDTTCQLQLNALRQFQVDIVPVTFYSVDGASFTQEFPDDAKLYPIKEPEWDIAYLHVHVERAICTFYWFHDDHYEIFSLSGGIFFPVEPPHPWTGAGCKIIPSR